jgi:hypothetical protein
VVADSSPSAPPADTPHIAGIRLCGGRITERLALALFRSNKQDSDLGIVTPDGLACSDGFACE